VYDVNPLHFLVIMATLVALGGAVAVIVLVIGRLRGQRRKKSV
jgi:hypothetical protein